MVRSLRISKMDDPTRIVGEPPSPIGRTSLATLRVRSRICNVCPVYLFPLNARLKTAFLLVSVVINITICGDWAGGVYSSDGFPGTCADAVADPSNYNSAIFTHASYLPLTRTSFTDALIRINSISVYQKS